MRSSASDRLAVFAANPFCFIRATRPAAARLIFYLGHLEAFDWNHIAVWAMEEPAFNQTFDRLFEAGIDPDSSNLPSDSERPNGRSNRRSALTASASASASTKCFRTRPETVVEMALEHRLMHAETFAYLLQNLPYEQKRAPRTARR